MEDDKGFGHFRSLYELKWLDWRRAKLREVAKIALFVRGKNWMDVDCKIWNYMTLVKREGLQYKTDWMVPSFFTDY